MLYSNISTDDTSDEALDFPTYVQIPVEALGNTFSTTEDSFEVVSNVILEQLSDGSFRLIRQPTEDCLTTHFEGTEDSQIPQNILTGIQCNQDNNVTVNICLENPAEPLSFLDNNLIANIISEASHQSVLSTTADQSCSPLKNYSYKYSCSTCSKHFENLKQYRDHLCNKKFVCQKCNAGYNEENNLKIHMVLIHSEDNITKCPICGINLTFQRTARLRSHMLMHQVEETYSCHECGVEYDTENDFLRHFERHKVGKVPKDDYLQCVHCKLKFDLAKDYRKHVSEHVKANKIFCKPRKMKSSSTKTNSSHVCAVCGKRFYKRSLLARHERIHNGEKPYKCTICEKGFSQKGSLQTHWKKHAGIRPHECTLCPAKFTQKGNLRVHIQKTHTVSDENQKFFKCWQCSCVFRKIAALNGHVTKFHSNPRPTNEIDEVMAHLKQLQQSAANMVVGTEDKASDDSHKGSAFIPTENADNQQISVDIKTEESDREYLTLTTELLTNGTTREHLIRHNKVDDMQWYYCNYCSAKVKKPSDLIRHLRVHTKEKPFQCKVCKAAFSLKVTLRYHMKTHSSNRVYSCSKCDFNAPSLRLLNAHRRKHKSEGSLLWKCATCDCRFDNFEEAQKHKSESTDRLHIIRPGVNVIPPSNSDERVVTPAVETVAVDIPDPISDTMTQEHFQCEVCGIKFSRKISMTRHLQNHRGDRKFKCSICPKAFITLHRLKEHLKFHNNVKNFGCRFCEKRYVTASLLKRHMTSHSSLRPYVCSHCSKAFKSIALCRRHIKKIHRGDEKVKTSAATDNAASAAMVISNENSQTILPASLNPMETIVDQVPENIGTNLDLVIQNLQATEPNIVANTDQPEQPLEEQYHTVFLDISNLNLLEDCNLDLNVLQKQSDEHPSLQQHSVNKLDALPADIIQILNSDGIINDTVVHLNQINNDNIAGTSINEVTYITNNSGLSEVINANDLLNALSMNPDNPNILNEVIQVIPNTALANNDIFDGTSIICRQCNNVYLNMSVFQNHCCDSVENNMASAEQSKKSPIPDERVQCEKCQKILKDKNALKGHMRLHMFKKSFECRVCEKVLVGRRTYQKHRATHAKLANLCNCKFCGKEFKKASDLKRHERTHTGEKPFACDVCNKKFTLKSTLASHRRTHEPNQKRCVCDICGRSFCSKPSLKLHLSVHTGQKRFSCIFCPQTFRTLSNKRSHEKLMHLTVKQRTLPNTEQPVNMRKVLESVAMDAVNNVDRKEDVKDENLILDQLSSQVLDVSVPHETLLSDISRDQTLAVDASALLQQLQLNGNIVESPLVLDDVTFFTLNSGKDEDLQIISLSDLGLQNGDIVIESLADDVPVNNQVKPTDKVECDICQQMYTSKNVLSKHKQNVHGVVKKLSCSKCIKRFCTLEELQAHDKLHQGYRPFTCPYCTNSFTEEQSYKTHMKRIHQHPVISDETTDALLSMDFDLKLAGSNIHL